MVGLRGVCVLASALCHTQVSLGAAVGSRRPGAASLNSLTHALVIGVVRRGDTVIDATCGNGHDALLLAGLALGASNGRLVCFDVQMSSIEATKTRLTSTPYVTAENVLYRCTSNRHIGEGAVEGSVGCIMYNLGYLPGSDKSVVTTKEDTVASLRTAVTLLRKGGLVTIMCYRGHEGGEEECAAVDVLCAGLDQETFVVQHHSLRNRVAPVLYTIYRNEMCNKPQLFKPES